MTLRAANVVKSHFRHSLIVSLILTGCTGTAAVTDASSTDSPAGSSTGDAAVDAATASRADGRGSDGGGSTERPQDSGDSDGANACLAPSTTCQPPAGTPLYRSPYDTDDVGKRFSQPKFGGDGWLGDQPAFYDGYSAVVTWPDQSAVLVDGDELVAAWPGANLENGYFIQNGYQTDRNANGPGTGNLWTYIFKVPGVIYDKYLAKKTYVAPNQKIQFKGERQGTEWIFSYRIVGPGLPAAFVEQGRYDLGEEARIIDYVILNTEMYDYHDAVERLAPITYGPVLLKSNGVWSPVNRMTAADDFGSERLFIRGEPAIAGVTTSLPGAMCYGQQPIDHAGALLWQQKDAACYAQMVDCDPITAACR